MKTIILLIIMFFMSSTLCASASHYLNDELSYKTNGSDVFSSGMVSFQANAESDLEFKLGMSNGFKRLNGSYQENSNLLERVVVWMSYRF